MAECKAYNAAVRDDLHAFFASMGLEFLSSQASFTMVKVNRPGEDVRRALAERRVFISSSGS